MLHLNQRLPTISSDLRFRNDVAGRFVSYQMKQMSNREIKSHGQIFSGFHIVGTAVVSYIAYQINVLVTIRHGHRERRVKLGTDLPTPDSLALHYFIPS